MYEQQAVLKQWWKTAGHKASDPAFLGTTPTFEVNIPIEDSQLINRSGLKHLMPKNEDSIQLDMVKQNI